MSQTITKNRSIRISNLLEQSDSEDLKTTTPQERWEMMWQLAQNAWAFKGEPIAKPGFYRHIIRIYRRKS